ncbi:alpha/beta fold hydrolase [Phycicoccus ginsengisoli]
MPAVPAKGVAPAVPAVPAKGPAATGGLLASAGRLRPVFRQLEQRSPALGGWLAERLWFRLPPTPAAAVRERRTPDGGEPLETVWSGGIVRGRAYGDWGLPTAYLVHGWGGWWQQLGAHVRPLVDAGLCVVAFDAPSHGASGAGSFGPRSTTLVEMGEALQAVIGDFGRPALVVSHSAGAMASMLAVDSGAPVEALVLIAPPVSVASIAAMVANALGAGPRSRRVMLARAERRVGLPMDGLDLVPLAARRPSLPRLLVVHDRSDAEVPVAGSVELTTAWHDARLLLTDGLGHRRVMWDPAVVRRVAAFAAVPEASA